jgi:hypothetical protein
MTASQSKPWIPYLVAFAIALLVIGAGLGRFGIWQPSELRVADMAREDASARESQVRPPLQLALVRAGFRALGPTEQGGRLPTALLAIAATVALAVAVGRASDARAGAFVGIAYATMPLVFMNARQMFGGGVAQSCFTLFLSAALFVLWGRPPPGVQDDPLAATEEKSRVAGTGASLWQYGRWALLAVFALAVLGAGWMLGVVPVLLGVGLAVLVRWRDESGTRRIVGVAFALVGAVVGVFALRAAISPAEAYSALTGMGGEVRAPSQLPTWEAFIEHIGHGIFPWTGIVAFGLVRLLTPPAMSGQPVGITGEVVSEQAAWRESGLRLAALLTAVVAFGLQSFHLQQFGMSPFIAAAPLAIAAGLAVRDAEREAAPWRIITAGATFVTVMMMRDYLQFPKTSYAALGLPDGGPPFPSGFTGTVRDWLQAHRAGAVGAIFKGTAPGEVYFVLEAVLFILIALSALFQGAGPVKAFGLARPFSWLGDVERQSREELAKESADRGALGWTRYLSGVGLLSHLRVILGALALALMVPFGLAGLLARGLTTPVRMAFFGIAAAPLAVLVATYAVLLLWGLFARLGEPAGSVMRLLGTRVAFVPVAAVTVALVMTQMFVPALSEHLSPRGVWAVIGQVRRNGEPVARYGGNQNDRATRYYANFDVTDIANESEAVAWLRQREPRHFMIAGADVFPSLNRAYRASFPQGERENVPVIDATNSNLYVAASDAGGRGSRNPLDAVVMSRDTRTRPRGDNWHPHGRQENGRFVAEPARFDDAIEYLGYNLDSNGMSYVPVGGSFKITYHFRVLQETRSNHQVFVHVDGQCPRINGDHEPAGGQYPVRHWLAGDIIHDEQRITIPGYCRAGTYSVFIGFFQGDSRMRVTGGDHDRENRVVAARIVVR